MEDPLELLLGGKISSVEFAGGQVTVDAPRGGRIYLPGSFNPLHDGHRYMTACKRCLALLKGPASGFKPHKIAAR